MLILFGGTSLTTLDEINTLVGKDNEPIEVLTIFNQYKTKVAVYNGLVKHFKDTKKVSEIGIYEAFIEGRKQIVRRWFVMDDIRFIPIDDYEYNSWEDKIKARCPKCFNIKTELKESGPINGIRCARCGFTIQEGSFHPSGKGYVIDLIDEWNRVGDYTHKD